MVGRSRGASLSLLLSCRLWILRPAGRVKQWKETADITFKGITSPALDQFEIRRVSRRQWWAIPRGQIIGIVAAAARCAGRADWIKGVRGWINQAPVGRAAFQASIRRRRRSSINSFPSLRPGHGLRSFLVMHSPSNHMPKERAIPVFRP